MALLHAGREHLRSVAEVQFLELLRARPDDAGVNLNLAIALEGLGRSEEAMKYFRKVLLLDPENAASQQALRQRGIR